MRFQNLSTVLTMVLLAGAGALAFGPIVWDEMTKTPNNDAEVELALSTPISGSFTLSVSWQPAFCEQREFKPECQSQTAARADATQFSLHGLWPEPRGNEYCGVSNSEVQADKRSDWRDLPRLALTDDLRAELDEVMPGTQSYLHRHEWIKHGTCSNGNAQSYYEASLALMEQLNRSAVADLFESAIGSSLDADDIRDAFDNAFGRGAGSRVSVECGNDGSRRLIDELRFSLEGEIGQDFQLGDLLRAAPSRQRGCPQGIVDRAGHQ